MCMAASSFFVDKRVGFNRKAKKKTAGDEK
jgi:hypothetical protein